MKKRSDWIQVADQRMADELLQIACAFHDGIVVSASWTGSEFVNRGRELELHGFGTLDLRVELQRKAVPLIELQFRGVSRFLYDYQRDASGVLTVGPDGVAGVLLAWEIDAEGLQYRAVCDDVPR